MNFPSCEDYDATFICWASLGLGFLLHVEVVCNLLLCCGIATTAFQSRHILNQIFSFMLAMTSSFSEGVACDDMISLYS